MANGTPLPSFPFPSLSSAPRRFVPLTPGQRAEAASFGKLPTVTAPPPRPPTPVAAAKAKKGIQQLPVLDASGKVTGYQDVKVRVKRGPRKAKAAPAAPTPAKAGKRGGRPAKKEGRAVAGFNREQWLTKLRSSGPQGSKAYMAVMRDMAAAKRAAGGGKPAKRKPRPAAAAASPSARRRPSAAPAAAAASVAPRRRRRRSAPPPMPAVAHAIVPVAPRPQKKRKTEAQIEREEHKATWLGQAETQYDKHRAIVRGVTILSVAVGAVKLNQQYPDGFTPLNLEASTLGALGSGLLAFAFRRFGWRRTSSTLVDVGLGFVTGTLSSNVGSGKTPLIAKKA